jgi:hypothetical protein
MSIASTGLSDYENSAAGDLGAFTLNEFCKLFRISKRTLYNEVSAGRLKLAKIRNRSIVTRGEARRYQRALETAA